MQHVPAPGSLVWLRQRRWRVERAQADRGSIRLDVANAAARLTILTPFDRPRPLTRSRRVVRVRRQHARARLGSLITMSPPAGLVAAAVAARMQLWPFQFEPVLAVLAGQRRLLIADAVGLGKTIQAGLILAEILRRNPDASALVIVPASLRRQWAEELESRFSVPVREMDAGRDDTAPPHWPGASPWHQPGICLTSIDFVKQRHVTGGIPPRAWDVVVVDEVHLATGRSDRHDTCDELGRRARHLVLLSATPHDGDTSRFSRLMRLGALPMTGDTLKVFCRTRQLVGLPDQRVVRWMRVPTPSAPAAVFDALLLFERTVLGAARPDTHDTTVLLLSVLRKRALSTLAAFDRSLERRLAWLETRPEDRQPAWRQPAFDFGDDDSMDDGLGALGADLTLPRARERAWLRRLRQLVAACGAEDPKLAVLSRWAARSTESFVLFTEFRDSLECAERTLRPFRTVATIHGGQSETARQEELSRFLSGQASVLLATDVGSQGLNLQHGARWLINLELPWNPVRIEQRIGRLDRIGQQRRVHATMLVHAHAAEDPLLESMCRRTLEVRRQFGSNALAAASPPNHLAVAAALIAGRPIGLSPPADVTPCSAYRRPARAQAVVTERRRRLARLWRGGDDSGRRPIQTTGPVPGRPGQTAAAIVSTLIVDRTGTLVERRLVALGMSGAARSGGNVRTTLERALPHLHRIVLARVRRLQLAATRRADRRAAVERAIARHLYLIAHPRQAQLGLFSQQAARAFDDARAETASSRDVAAHRLALEEDRRHLAATPMAVEWIVTVR